MTKTKNLFLIFFLSLMILVPAQAFAEIAEADLAKADTANAETAKTVTSNNEVKKADISKAEVKKAEEVSKAEAKKADKEAKKAEAQKLEDAKKAEDAKKSEEKKAEDAKKAEEDAKKAEQEAKEAEEAAAAALAQMWEARFKEAESLEREVNYYKEQVNIIAPEIKAGLDSASTTAGTLLGLYKVSRTVPNEQLTFIYQMRQMESRIKHDAQPLKKLSVEISKRLEEVEILQQEVVGIADKPKSGEGISAAADDKVRLRQYGNRINTIKHSLSDINKRAKKELEPVEGLIARLNTSIQEITDGLPETWKNYYLTPSSFNMGTVTNFPKAAVEWGKSLESSLLFLMPATFKDWMNVSRSFGFTFIFMSGLGVILYRSARYMPEDWNKGFKHTIKRSWPWLTLGLAFLLSASNTQTGTVYLSFMVVGVLAIIWGIAGFSWRLRWTANPELQGKSVPLVRFFPPAAIGIFLLQANLPGRQLGVLWFVIMLAFIFLVWRMSRGAEGRGDHHKFLEKILYSFSFLFGVVSLIVGVAGYPRMAILVYMLLFAIANALTLGNALADFSVMLVGLWANSEEKPVRNSLGRAIAIPTAWLVSVFCILPWLWAVPGATYIIDGFMQKGYTIGEASFNFSKLLAVVALYILFRSLSGLGKTSLTHLPDRMPHIERGVIPPLRTMFSYGMWVLFAIIVLSLLGVSFTSLAVVAGGLSVGIGFGMQNIFNNLISGIMLIFGRTILVGDWVQVSGTEGTVKAISIRSTTIQTVEGALAYVPNSVIMSGQFINWTRGSRRVRCTLPIITGYSKDAGAIADMLLGVAKEHPNVLSYPAPSVRLLDTTTRDLNFSLIVHINDFDNKGTTLSDLRFGIAKVFAENDVPQAIPEMVYIPDKGAPEHFIPVEEGGDGAK